jgi:hypothetical protein
LNEKFAPELLESKEELVECMLGQIKEMVNKSFPITSLLSNGTQRIQNIV